MLELKQLADDPNTEAALAKLAQEEMAEHRDQVQQLQKQLLTLLVPKDVADDANAIIEVRAGRRTNLGNRTVRYLWGPVVTGGPPCGPPAACAWPAQARAAARPPFLRASCRACTSGTPRSAGGGTS